MFSSIWVVEGSLWKALPREFCREAGARCVHKCTGEGLDLLPLQHADVRRLEVVADGLPLYHGAQIAVDTTLVSPLRRTAPRTVVVLGKTVPLFKPEGGKNGCIQNSPVHMEEPDWLFSQMKLEVDGPWRRKLSSGNLHGRSLVRNLPISGPAPNWHGPGDGA